MRRDPTALIGGTPAPIRRCIRAWSANAWTRLGVRALVHFVQFRNPPPLFLRC